MSHTRALSLKSLANGIPAFLILVTIGGMTWVGALAWMVLWLLRSLGTEINPSALFLLPLALLAVEGLFFHPYLNRLAGIDSLGPAVGGRRRP